MRTFAFFFAAFMSAFLLIANWSDMSQAWVNGQFLLVAFSVAEALLPPAFLVYLFLPPSSSWNVAIGGLLLLRGMDHIILGTDIGLWEDIPGQGDTAGAVLVVIALVVFGNTLYARKDLSARI